MTIQNEIYTKALDLLKTNKNINKTSLAYKSAVEILMNPGTPVSCGKNTGTGRFSSSTSWQADTKNLLIRAGVSSMYIILGNTAARGGKAGDFVKVIQFQNVIL